MENDRKRNMVIRFLFYQVYDMERPMGVHLNCVAYDSECSVGIHLNEA